MQRLDFSHMAHMQEFAPIVEVRLAAEYQVTRPCRSTAVGRPCGSATGPPQRHDRLYLGETQTFGILTNKNRQNLFMNGLELGVAINY